MMQPKHSICLLICISLLALITAESSAQLRYKIAYATYLGGSGGEQLREVIPLPDGSVLVGGQTSSTDLPTTEGVVQPAYAGDDPALGHPGVYGGDCFLVRLSADGREILGATYFGGSKQERNVYGMALDKQDNVIITSGTRSTDLPTTPGCFQPGYGGGATDWFVAKLSPDFKQLLWCTYIGGSGDGMPRGGLTLDENDNVYVVGGTASSDFPTTSDVLQSALKGTRDVALVKLKPDGSDLVFSTLIGGDGSDNTIMGVRADKAGNSYVAGHTQSADFPLIVGAAQSELGGESDCFIAKISSDGSRLIYSTYLGGSENEFAEHQPRLAADGTLLLTGVTASLDFPTTPGAFQRNLKGKTDGFITRLSADGRKLVFSTLLGGSGGDFWLMPTLDDSGRIFVVGQTESRDFPVTPNALQTTYGGGRGDGVLAVLNADGSELLYATYLGGSSGEMIRSLALGQDGEIYLVGNTSSQDFPITPDSAQTKLGGTVDSFVVKLTLERKGK